MLTILGKIMVLVNVVLSLGFAIWAFAIYSNRIDWTTTKSADQMGEFAKRDTQLQGLKSMLERGEASLASARTNVAAEEERVPRNQAWYKEQLDRLRVGKNQVQALVSSEGKLQLDRDGLPELGPVLSASKQPVGGLASIEALNQDYAAKHQTFLETTRELDKTLEAERALTQEIGNGQDRGLRAQLAAVELAEKNSLDEQEFIKPLLYNRAVEGELLVKRGKALEARLKELAAARFAASQAAAREQSPASRNP